jgi:predicted acylesterase/phospholipase RssA
MYKIIFVLLFVLTGCKTTPGKTSLPTSPSNTPGSGSGSGTRETPLTREVPNVAVVLGPGGAKALAHAGVIKALQENHIPINKIIGIEWGSLIAAAFAMHGQFHEVDWKLYRLDQVDLNAKGLFGLGRGDRTIKILDGFLKENFGTADFAGLKIPFSCPTRNYWSGALVMQQRGVLSDALRKCLPFPPLFQIRGNWVAGATASRQIVEQLKAENIRLIVFVDVLGSALPFEKEKLTDDPNSVILWQEVQRSINDVQSLASETIRVSTDNIFLDRFNARKELTQAGEQEGIRAAQRLSAKYGF